MKLLKTVLSLLMAATLAFSFAAGAENDPGSPGAETAGRCLPARECTGELEPGRPAKDAEHMLPRGGLMPDTPAVRDVFVFASLINESFEPSSGLEGWWMYDGDGDGEAWHWSKEQAEYAFNGSGFMFSLSYNVNMALDTDNWLITPEVSVPAAEYYLSFYGMSRSESFKDHVQILAGRRGQAFDGNGNIWPDRWQTVMELTELPGEYTQFLVDLSQFAGSTIALAIRHRDGEELAALVDRVQVGYAEVVDVEAVTVSRQALALSECDSAKLSAVVEPADASAPGIIWSTSDPSVAVVNKCGGVIAMGPGTALITASASNGVSSSCAVTVSPGYRGFAAGTMMGYAVHDLDSGAEPFIWYGLDEFGGIEAVHTDGRNELVAPVWDPVGERIYAYRPNSSGGYDFVSVEPEARFSVSVVASSVELPWWTSYDFDKGVICGGFIGLDEEGIVDSFKIAEIDIETGCRGTVRADVYNDPYIAADGTVSQQGRFLPLYGTYAGGGAFIGADHEMNELMVYRPDPGGNGFAVMPFGTAEFSSEVGRITGYTQGLYYNPLDGMLYWNYVNTASAMLVADPETGIVCETGVIGAHGAYRGIETAGIFCMYSRPRTPLGYHPNDYQKLRAFLECEDASGIKNGYKLDRGYDPDDPDTWRGQGVTISWSRIGGSYRLVRLNVSGKGLVGRLDLSGCTELTSVYCADNTIERVSVEGCMRLGTVNCGNNGLKLLNAKACPALRSISCSGNCLERIDMRGSFVLWPGMLSAGEGGTIDCVCSGGCRAEATPDEGRYFEGWFDESGAPVSDRAAFDLAHAAARELTAVFARPNLLYGDANLDGELSFADISALYSIITGAGDFTSEQLTIADFNRDDQLSFGDLSDLYNYLIRP